MWRWRGLGASAWQVARFLDPCSPTDAAELVQATGLHPRAVQRALSRLYGYRLVRRVAGGGWVLAAADLAEPLDTAAETLGVAGIGVRDRDLHDLQRRNYRRWRATRVAALDGDQPRVLIDPDTGTRWLLRRTTGDLIDPDHLGLAS